MTITEYNEIFKYPCVKRMELTFKESGYQDIVLTNTDICTEEMSLEEALCSDEEIRYGACEASCFKVRVVNSASFKGKMLYVKMKIVVDDERYLIDSQGNRIVTDDGDYIIVNIGERDDEIPMGVYKVFSDEPTNDRMWRDLVCYDLMYDIQNANVKEFYTFHKTNNRFPMTLKTLRDMFFDYLRKTDQWRLISTPILPSDFEVVETTLCNDTFPTKGDFNVSETLSGKSLIEAICELNGCFGHINREGKFEFVTIPSQETITYDWYISDDSAKYEDYMTDKITGIIARSALSDIGTQYGKKANALILENNYLLYGHDGDHQWQLAAQRLFNAIKDITYRPFQINTYGNPCLPIGTSIVINTKKYNPQQGYQDFTINSFVKARVLTGIQGLVDSFETTGKQNRGNDVNSLESQIIRTGGKVHKVEIDLENFISYIEDEDYSTKIAQNKEAIELEATRAQNAEEIAGVSTGFTTTGAPSGGVIIQTNITKQGTLADGNRIGVWVKGMPSQYENHDKYVSLVLDSGESQQTVVLPIFYTGSTPLTNQYNDGVILHLMYMADQQFTDGSSTVTLTGYWVGADDTRAQLQVTADGIYTYVGNNYVSQSAYDAEVQNLQDQIDGRVEYWDGNVVPTLQNAPAVNWQTDADKSSHVGDLYRYHHGTPEVVDYYRFDKDSSTTPASYSWVALGASEVDEALRKAEEANAKADAAQNQLDQFELTTTQNFSSVNQTVNGINLRVQGVEAREVVKTSFATTATTISTGNKAYTLNPTLSSIEDGTRLSILITLGSSVWDTTSNKYIKINSSASNIPIYYQNTTRLVKQIGIGDTLNVRYYSNYPRTNTAAFVVEDSDQTYNLLESELDVQRGQIVLRVNNNGQLVEQRLDATGTASVWTVTADNISLEANDVFNIIAGGTLHLGGTNGVVVETEGGNGLIVDRSGNVYVTGAITATSLTLAPNAQTNLASVATSGDYDDLSGTPNLAPVATSGSYSDLDDSPDLTIYLTKTGTITRGTFQEGATGINISSQGLLQASNAVIYGTIYASAGKFAGEIQANSGKIAGFTITSTSLQKSSSTTGFSLSESMLYFSSGSNEANTLSVGPLGLSTKGYVQAESITKKSSSSKWGGINNNLDTALQTLKTLVQVTTVTESYRLDTSERTYSATKTFTVPTGYSAQMVVCSKTGNNQVRIYSCYLTGTGGNTINYSIRYDGNSSVSNSLEFKVLLIRT